MAAATADEPALPPPPGGRSKVSAASNPDRRGPYKRKNAKLKAKAHVEES